MNADRLIERKWLVSYMVIALAGGCSSAGPYLAVVPVQDEQTVFACVARTMAELGYVPEVTNEQTGTIRGVDAQGGYETTMVAQFVGGAESRSLRVQTSMVSDDGQERRHLGSTERTRAHADTVAECASENP